MITLEEIRAALQATKGTRALPGHILMNRVTLDALEDQTGVRLASSAFGFPVVIDPSVPDGKFRWGYRS